MFKYVVNNENSENKPVVIVLGGTVPHRGLIETLKERGYYTIVVDYFENPPAAKQADVHCKESAMDYEVVLNVAKENNAQLVLSSCLDQQMNIAMQVAETLNLPHPFSPQKAVEVTNKRLMKKIMMDYGIPTARYYAVDKNTDLESIVLDYPIIVKPVDNSGSAGVIKVETPEELKAAIDESLNLSRSKSLVVEEFIEGTEMSTHGFAENGKIHLLFGTCRITAVEGDLYQQLCNVYLTDIKPLIKMKIENIINKLIEAFDLPSDTPMFTQVMVKDDDVYVVEFSPRLGGGISSYVAKECADFDLYNYSIDTYLGKHEDRGKGILKKYVCCCPIHCKEGIFDKVKGAEELLKDKTAIEYFVLKSKGDHIDRVKPSSSLVMKYVVEGDTPMECFYKMKEANKRTEILDVDGNSIRDYSFELTEELFLNKLSKITD